MLIDREGHVIELQTLRGIAALTVLAAHAMGYAAVTPGWLVPVRLVFNAHAAVVLFFVLSGYVLTRSLRGRLENFGDLVRYYIKRLFRIYPALWAATLLGIAYLQFIHVRPALPGAADWIARMFQPADVGPRAYGLAMAGTAHVLPQGWSIFIEILASAGLPLLAWSLYRQRIVFAALLAGLLLLSFTVRTSPYQIATYLVDFAIGASLAAAPLAVRNRLSRLNPPAAALCFGIAVTVLIGLRSLWITSYDDPGPQLAEALLATFLIALVVHSQLNLAPLRSRTASLVGDISYSIYLLHFPVMCIAAATLGKVITPAAAPNLFPVALLSTTLVFTLAGAWLSYRWIELPGIAAGKRVAAALHTRLAAA